ncbi:molybdopterin-dependent oxidoreductase [Amnibacterium flavum]|uniref:Molybdopterin-binding protein n=1 Tax=Amnibacterium flavum TaxID=2173173 RepID=A0A2V1HLC9_9MICO|nr:molybdopterin-dependent oxidoreductase [Amnibacterium flavum]PVZ93456.1 molybdopterin-binding protein [Amnibacterium flavum]
MRRLLFLARAGLVSPARTPRRAVVLGRLLGGAFLLCFATGLVSHFIQHPAAWMGFPNQPFWIYQLNQGVHVATGILCIPLILGKLWTVYPDLFSYPPVRSIGQLLERGSIAVFVGSSLLQLVIGVLNIFQFLPLPFYFLQVHYALSFVIIGSLAIHIGVKLPVISRHWRRGRPEGVLEAYLDDEDDTERSHRQDDRLDPTYASPTRGLTGRVMTFIDSTPPPPAKVSRRTVIAAVGLSAVTLVGTTVGQTLTPLDSVNFFGPRKKGDGPQGVPINRTSKQADVRTSALDPAWVLTVVGAADRRVLDLAALRAMPQTTVRLPIACVEGWSQMANWRGVRLAELIALVGESDVPVRLRSLEERGPYKTTTMDANFVSDPTTLVALELNGETLDLEHGYPARIIAPGRPGVLQTKWLSIVEVIR